MSRHSPSRRRSKSPSPCPASRQKSLDLSRSHSFHTHAQEHRVFRACDLIVEETLGQGFFGKAVKVCVLNSFLQKNNSVAYQQFALLYNPPYNMCNFYIDFSLKRSSKTCHRICWLTFSFERVLWFAISHYCYKRKKS